MRHRPLDGLEHEAALPSLCGGAAQEGEEVGDREPGRGGGKYERVRQEAALNMVPVDEDAFLLDLLFLFKQSFRLSKHSCASFLQSLLMMSVVCLI